MATTTRKPKRQKPQKQRRERAEIRPGELLWVRLGILFLAVGAVAVAAYWAQQKLADPSLLPVQSVVLDGDFLHTERDELQRVIAGSIHGGYFTIDVREVQDAVRQLPWVAGATVRRVWPDTLVVSVTEHHPFARWGEKRLISERGVVFTPATIEPFTGLALFAGDDERAGEVLRQFRYISKSFENLARIERIEMNSRGGWTLWIHTGARIELGNDRVPQRLVRVTRFLARIGEQTSTVEVIDARYSGGVAVRLKQQTEDNLEQPGESRA
ncbi:MAG: FtsQ-type POTRA domain-containing protein [Gammaproteobacteria bacterium]|jgi:cell division protein FtsQ